MAVSAGRAVPRLDGQGQADDHRFRAVQIVEISLDAQQRSNARPELQRVERLGHEVVSAGVDATQPAGRVVERRDQDHRYQPRGRILFDGPAGLEAVEMRHHDIHQDEIRRLATDGVERFGAISGPPRRMTIRREHRLGQSCAPFDVIDDQNRSHDVAPQSCSTTVNGDSLRVPFPFGPPILTRAHVIALTRLYVTNLHTDQLSRESRERHFHPRRQQARDDSDHTRDQYRYVTASRARCTEQPRRLGFTRTLATAFAAHRPPRCRCRLCMRPHEGRTT